MFKTAFSLFLAIIFLVSFSHPTLAAELSLGLWHAAGYQMWRTSFPLNNGSGNGASELYYPQPGTYITANFENKLAKNRTFRVEAGLSSADSRGIGSDSDWNYTQSKGLWYYGTFKTGGVNRYLSIDWHHLIRSNVSVFYGYGYRVNHIRMTDGLYTVANYISPLHQQLPDLNSIYTMVYQGPHIGLVVKHPLTSAISSFASVSYSPFALAQGHGWWNLRNLDFTHNGRAQMLATELGLRFALDNKNDAFILGYRYHYNSVFHGQENLSSAISWDKAINIQRGLYFGGEKQF